MKRCLICGKPTSSCCSLCKTAFYCSNQHQVQDWPRHKFICSGRSHLPESSHSRSIQRSGPNSSKEATRSVKPKPKHIATQPSSIYISQPESLPQVFTKEKKSASVEELLAKTDHFIELNQRRKGERRQLILEYVKAKEGLIGRCQALVKLSYEIWSGFITEIAPILFREYRIRTSKFMQQLEYLLDIAYLCKLYLKNNQREKLKEILYQLELPDFPQKVDVVNDEVNDKSLQMYKNYKQQVQSYRKVLSLLAAVSNAGGFTNFTQKLYARYIMLVQQSSGANQQFLAYYLVGIWYTQVQQFNKAIACFNHCISLMEPLLSVPSNPIVPAPSHMLLSNCYYNIALSQRMLNKIEESCDSMLNCLAMRREETVKNQIEVSDCLEFIGKQFMELEKYEDCIDYLNQCHKIRFELLKPEDQKLQRIRELVKLLYKQIKHKREGKEMFDTRGADTLIRTENRLVELIRREYPEIQTFLDKIRKNQKTKLNIRIDEQWFNDINTQELESFAKVINDCEQLQPDDAIANFFESKFYNSLSPERKIRLKQLNPTLTQL